MKAAAADFHKRFVASTGLSPAMLQSLGAIAVLASHIEHWTERAIWALEGKPVKGMRPDTDGKPISELIVRVRALAGKQSRPELAKVMKTWADGVEPAFRCRNSIFHGITHGFPGSWTKFIKNVSTDGAVRKKPTSDFHANEHTLALLEEALGHCLAGIHLIKIAAETSVPLGPTDQVIADLQRVRSIATELEDLAAAATHEKY